MRYEVWRFERASVLVVVGLGVRLGWGLNVKAVRRHLKEILGRLPDPS